MPKTKISEYSTTNSSNTDIESINIDEGCAPSGINNAIRELMVHLKEFQTGSSGDPLTVAGGMFISGGGSANTLTVTGILTASGGTILSSTNTLSGSNIISGNINSSGSANTFSGGVVHSGTNTFSSSVIISGNINSSGTTNTFSGGNILSGTNTFSGTNIFSSDVTLNAQSDLRFADSDSSNWVALQAPATIASNVTWTLPAADGTSNQVLATNGSGTLSWATAGGGASISAGDSKVEVTDTGSNGTIVFNTDNAERARITSAGAFLVACTSTTKTNDGFRVESGVPNTSRGSAGGFYEFYDTGSGSRIGYISNSGGTTTVYNTSSDYRLKENIAPMIGALTTVQQLKPCTYTWKSNGSAGQGFIAHELQAVVPDAVTGEKDAVNEDGSIKPQGVDTSFLVATLTAAIQELKAELDTVKAQNAAFEARLAALESA